MTALQIAALKRLSRGSRLLVLDRNGGGGGAKAVARALAERGFGKVYVIKGGFQGWQASKLRTKSANVVSRVEVLPPGSFGTGGSRGSPAPRQLPSGSRSTQGSRSSSPLPAAATTVSSRRALPSPSSSQ